MIVQDQRAFDKAQRRATRNKIRNSGSDVMGLLKPGALLSTQHRAEDKFLTIKRYNRVLDSAFSTMGEKVQARKAKKKMQEHWLDRNTKPGTWFVPDGAGTAGGKEKKRRGPVSPRI